MPTYRVETSRLLLRRPDPADDGPLAPINADPEVMRFIGDGSPRTPEQTTAMIERGIREWAERGYGMVSVVRRDTGEYIGCILLTPPAYLPEVMPAVEIGWRLARGHWGQGFATEAAARVLESAFSEFGLDRILSIRHFENEASGRVMEKLGLHKDSETAVPSRGLPLAVHSLTRAEYRAML
jgi:RimJ/RimL family protein N-acetyltransferase